MIGDVERHARREAVDGALQRVVLERLQAAAAVAHQVVVVLAGVRALRFVARHAVADVHAGEQSERDELVEHAVDRGAADAPAVAGAQPVLDVERGERAGLLVEQLDHGLAGAAAPVAGAGEPLERVLRPRLPGSAISP